MRTVNMSRRLNSSGRPTPRESSGSGRLSRSNALSHFPFKDERGSVADILHANQSDSLFLKMAKPARRRFATKVFEELSVGNGRMLMRDVPVALKSLGLEVPLVLEKACRRLYRPTSGTSDNASSDMKVDLQQWFKIIQRCVVEWSRQKRETAEYNNMLRADYLDHRQQQQQEQPYYLSGRPGPENTRRNSRAEGVTEERSSYPGYTGYPPAGTRRDGFLRDMRSSEVSSDISTGGNNYDDDEVSGDLSLSAEQSVYIGTEDDPSLDDATPWFPAAAEATRNQGNSKRTGGSGAGAGNMSSHARFMLQLQSTQANKPTEKVDYPTGSVPPRIRPSNSYSNSNINSYHYFESDPKRWTSANRAMIDRVQAQARGSSSSSFANTGPGASTSAANNGTGSRRYKPQHQRSGIYASDPRERYQGIGYQYQETKYTAAAAATQPIRRQPTVNSRIADQVRADRAAWQRERRSIANSALSAVAKQRVNELLPSESAYYDDEEDDDPAAGPSVGDGDNQDRRFEVPILFKEPRPEQRQQQQQWATASAGGRFIPQTVAGYHHQQPPPSFDSTQHRHRASSSSSHRLRDLTSGAATLQIADAFLNGPIGREVTSSSASALQYFLTSFDFDRDYGAGDGGQEGGGQYDGDGGSADSPLLDSEPSEVLAAKIFELAATAGAFTRKSAAIKDIRAASDKKTLESFGIRDAGKPSRSVSIAAAEQQQRRGRVHEEERQREDEEYGGEEKRGGGGETREEGQEKRAADDSSDMGDIDDLLVGLGGGGDRSKTTATAAGAAVATKGPQHAERGAFVATAAAAGGDDAVVGHNNVFASKTMPAASINKGGEDGWNSTGGGWVMNFGPQHTTKMSREAERRAYALQVQRELHIKKNDIASKAAAAADQLILNRDGGRDDAIIYFQVPVSQSRHPVESSDDILPILQAVEAVTLAASLSSTAGDGVNCHFSPEHVDYDGVGYYPTAAAATAPADSSTAAAAACDDAYGDQGKRAEKEKEEEEEDVSSSSSTTGRGEEEGGGGWKEAPVTATNASEGDDGDDDEFIEDSSGDDDPDGRGQRRPYFEIGDDDLENTGIAAVGGDDESGGIDSHIESQSLSQSLSHYVDGDDTAALLGTSTSTGYGTSSDAGIVRAGYNSSTAHSISESTNSTNFGAYADLDIDTSTGISI